MLCQVSGSSVPKCLTTDMGLWPPGFVQCDSVPPLPCLGCVPHLCSCPCRTASSALPHFATFGLGLPQHLTQAWPYLRAGCTSWGAEERHMSGSTVLRKLPCESLPSFRHIWLRGSTCAGGTITCVYAGSSSILCVFPAPSPASLFHLPSPAHLSSSLP